MKKNIDQCSIDAYDQYKRTKMGSDWNQIIRIFVESDFPLTARDVLEKCKGTDLIKVRSRITELTDAEVLRKADKTLDGITYKMVNAWEIVK